MEQPLSGADVTSNMLAFTAPTQQWLMSCLSPLHGTKEVTEPTEHKFLILLYVQPLQGETLVWMENSKRTYHSPPPTTKYSNHLLNLNKGLLWWLLWLFKWSKISSSHSRDKSTFNIIYPVLVIDGNIMTHLEEPFSSFDKHCWVLK